MPKVTPHVSFQEQITTYPQMADVAGSITIVPIVSNYGVLEPKIVTKRQLIEEYTDGKIRKSDHITLKTASILANTTSLMVCRAEQSTKDHKSAINLVNGKQYYYYPDSGSVTKSNYLIPTGVIKEPISEGKFRGHFDFAHIAEYNLTINWNEVVLKFEGVQNITSENVAKIVQNAQSKWRIDFTEDVPYEDYIQLKVTFTVNKVSYSFKFGMVTSSWYAEHGFNDKNGNPLNSEPIYNEETIDISSFKGALLVYEPIIDGNSAQNIIVSSESHGNRAIINVTDNQKQYQLEVSYNPDEVNGYGTRLFIGDVIESSGLNFSYVPINDPKTFSSFTEVHLVSDITYDRSKEGINNSITEACTKLARYRRDRQIDFIFDGGLAESTMIPTYENLAKKRRSLAVISTPPTIKKWNDLKSWVTSINSFMVTSETGLPYVHVVTPALKDTGVFGWLEYIPYSLYYIMGVLANASGNMKFAPTFGYNTGRVSGKTHSIELEYSNDPDELALGDDECPQTEWLQRNGVMPVIYDSTYGFSYIVNNNLLSSPNLNELCEENNRRLFNKVQFEINTILDKFISKSNDSVTRDDLDNALKTYKSENIDTLGYTLNDLKWDIKPFNPARRNFLDIVVECQFMNSIKYVNVLYRSIPMTE